MVNIHACLCDLFSQAISAAYPDLPETSRSVQITPAKKHGDYQCNNAMSLTQVSCSAVWLLKEGWCFKKFVLRSMDATITIGVEVLLCACGLVLCRP